MSGKGRRGNPLWLPDRGWDKASTVKRLRSQQGIALLMVVWMGTFLSIVLSSFAFSMRTEQLAAKNFKEREEARSLAMAGIATAVTDIVNRDRKEGRGAATTDLYNPIRRPLGRGSYEVIVSEEEGKIALNLASPVTLRALLRNSGVTDSSLLAGIVDSILDWLDADQERRLYGAEEEYYRSLSPSYRPRNGPLENLDELLLVKGLTPEIVYGNIEDAQRAAYLRSMNPTERGFRPGEYLGIYSSLTIHSSGSVNLNTAGTDVLVAAGLTFEQAQSIQYRRARSPLTAQQPDLPRGQRWTTAGRAFRIESVGRIDKSVALHRIMATVVDEGKAGRPSLRFVDWHEGQG